MFSPPWDPRFPALSFLFGPRSPDLGSSSYTPRRDGSSLRSMRGSKPSYDKPYKSTRYTDPETSSDWDDPYALDTDTDIFAQHRFSPPRSYSPPSCRCFSPRDPDVTRTSILLPSASAGKLRPDDILILPPLIHLHISLSTPDSPPQSLHASVPDSMPFGDVIKQIVHTYVGEETRSTDVTARVEQRGRMREATGQVTVGELARRGEVVRGGRRALRVEVEVGGGEEMFGRGRYGGRGPWGGAREVEMVREREVSRARVAHV